MRSFLCHVFMLVCACVLLFGCGGKVEKPKEQGPSHIAQKDQSHLDQITCIGLLPSASQVKGQVAPVYLPEDKSLRKGVQVFNEILSQELGGKDKIRFVGLDQIASLELTGGENALALARMVGERVNCNAILESTVKRFTERVGGRYSVESPAAVAFEMRLISLENDSILWSAKFDEVQKSVMENLLEWNKANTRGFVWITAEELMREGVLGKLADSPYFTSAEK